jgi:hypothetical protein
MRTFQLDSRSHLMAPYRMRFISALMLVICAPLPAAAAPAGSDMGDRYRDLSRCMEHAIGKGWQDRYAIHMMNNRWGALEPSEAELDSAPQAVRLADMSCRREVRLVPEERD